MTTTLFLFPFFFFFFRVTKFGMLLILTEKSGFIQQQSCFSSLLARAIDKIPAWGPYATLAGPDGFFRTCSRHHVRPSYGDFLNSFAMKARVGPYGSYNKNSYYHSNDTTAPSRCESNVHWLAINSISMNWVRNLTNLTDKCKWMHQNKNRKRTCGRTKNA